MYLEFVQFLTHRALQVRRSWFQPILGNERQGTRFSPYPRLTEDFPVRKIQGTGNLTVETHANFGELFRDPWGVVHRNVREDLAVERDAGNFQAVNQLAIGQAIVPSGCSYALDPELAILALFDAAIALGVAIGAIGGFLRGLVELALGEEKAF